MIMKLDIQYIRYEFIKFYYNGEEIPLLVDQNLEKDIINCLKKIKFNENDPSEYNKMIISGCIRTLMRGF